MSSVIPSTNVYYYGATVELQTTRSSYTSTCGWPLSSPSLQRVYTKLCAQEDRKSVEGKYSRIDDTYH